MYVTIPFLDGERTYWFIYDLLIDLSELLILQTDFILYYYYISFSIYHGCDFNVYISMTPGIQKKNEVLSANAYLLGPRHEPKT